MLQARKLQRINKVSNQNWIAFSIVVSYIKWKILLYMKSNNFSTLEHIWTYHNIESFKRMRTNCGLMTKYGDTDLGQHWLK